MPPETYPLEALFRKTVRDSFVDTIELNDPEMIDYVTRVLCEFSDSKNLRHLDNTDGPFIETIAGRLHAADPVFGTAASFDEERSVRRSIGDYALFIAGMRLDVVESAPNYHADRAVVEELIRIGRESYFIVSHFNMFEYEKESQLFARLAESFDRCVLGIALVRDELDDCRALGSMRI
ncbi:MAG TPA: hypothetical protein VHZ28_13705 [Terracidiphilus sp.]|jgi:hypothetical protein|nr:hypothetical protein [Terracidiphilus sp.]